MRNEIRFFRIALKRRKAALELLRQQDIVNALTSRGMATLQHRRALQDAQKAYDRVTAEFDRLIQIIY